jgi:hypothetical protein
MKTRMVLVFFIVFMAGRLKPGYNIIRMGNSYNRAPDIDCFTLTKK